MVEGAVVLVQRHHPVLRQALAGLERDAVESLGREALDGVAVDPFDLHGRASLSCVHARASPGAAVSVPGSRPGVLNAAPALPSIVFVGAAPIPG